MSKWREKRLESGERVPLAPEPMSAAEAMDPTKPLECLRPTLEWLDGKDARIAGLEADNANLAMALRYYLHDHPENCGCYACVAVRRTVSV